jgi:LysM repeat protein
VDGTGVGRLGVVNSGICKDLSTGQAAVSDRTFGAGGQPTLIWPPMSTPPPIPPRGSRLGILPWLVAGALLFGLAALGGFGAAYLVTTAQAVPTVDPGRLATPTPAPTPTAATTPSPASTASPTPSPTATPALSPSPSPSAGGTPSASPSPSATPLAYVVKKGDRLNDIAARFGVSADAIVALNHLSDPNHIEIGQVLLIPVP